MHKKFIALLIMAFLFSACSMPYVKHAKVRGVYHRVKSGETLLQIAKSYNINLQELAEVNNIVDPNLIQADSVMFIPDANQVIDDIMSSAKLAGVSEGTLKVDKTTRQPYQAEAMKEASIKPPVMTLNKDAETIKDERIKTSASTIKEEDITKETSTVKTLPAMKNSKPERKVIQSDKDQVRAETAIVKDELKAAVPLKEKDKEAKDIRYRHRPARYKGTRENRNGKQDRDPG